jgi:hypothetical protein
MSPQFKELEPMRYSTLSQTTSDLLSMPLDSEDVIETDDSELVACVIRHAHGWTLSVSRFAIVAAGAPAEEYFSTEETSDSPAYVAGMIGGL